MATGTQGGVDKHGLIPRRFYLGAQEIGHALAHDWHVAVVFGHIII